MSLIASLSSTVIALAFGFPLAWLLARKQFPGKGMVRGLSTLPMVLPPVVGGIALLLAYGRKGFIGKPLEAPPGSRCRSPWPASWSPSRSWPCRSS